jgi:hypothetical protein
MHGCKARHHVASEQSEAGQLVAGIGVVEQFTNVGSIAHGDGLVITYRGDVEKSTEDSELG